jgi:Protein of unknown function (DUF2971)
LDAIANLELRVTPPNEFNDPFEFIPRIEVKDEAEHKVYYESYRKPGMPEITFEEFKHRRIAERHCDLIRSAVLSVVSQQFTVLCLSATPREVTQWVHYADNHRGLVVELCMEEEPFRSILAAKLGRHVEVNYLPPEKRNVVSLREFSELNQGVSDARERADNMEQMLYRVAREKSEEWANEKEYRMIVPLPPPGLYEDAPVYSRLVNGRVLHLLKLNQRAIRRVILGVQTPAEFEREVRKGAARHGIGSERITRARLNIDRYAVEID